MKKRVLRCSSLLFVIAIVFMTSSVYAKNVYFTNSNNVEMTELQYLKMLDIFSERKVNVLTQEEFDRYKDANIISQDVKYQETIYKNGQIFSERELTKEEYDAVDENKPNVSLHNSDNDHFETTYKKLSGNLLDLGGFSLLGTLSWKKMPACRSYDVFAFRLNHFNYVGFGGSQVYFKGSTGTTISYDTTSEGYKAQSNGAGVSMNLKDDSDITGFELAITTDLYINSTDYSQAHAYISYQHAQNDLSREDSKSYTLDISGLGNVVYFSNTTIRNKYDGMSGLHLITPI